MKHAHGLVRARILTKLDTWVSFNERTEINLDSWTKLQISIIGLDNFDFKMYYDCQIWNRCKLFFVQLNTVKRLQPKHYILFHLRNYNANFSPFLLIKFGKLENHLSADYFKSLDLYNFLKISFSA